MVKFVVEVSTNGWTIEEALENQLQLKRPCLKSVILNTSYAC